MGVGALFFAFMSMTSVMQAATPARSQAAALSDFQRRATEFAQLHQRLAKQVGVLDETRSQAEIATRAANHEPPGTTTIARSWWWKSTVMSSIFKRSHGPAPRSTRASSRGVRQNEGRRSVTESKGEKPRERPHGHRDRGRIDEGPRKSNGDSTTRTQGPDPASPEGDETVAYPKGR